MNRNGSTSKPHTALLGRPPRPKKTEAPPIVTSALGPPPPDLADAGRDFWNAYRAEREPLGWRARSMSRSWRSPAAD
jgi:hypothetical protein